MSLPVKREFAQMSVGQDQRQPGQAAHVGDDGELDLAHRELGVGAGVADVDGGDQVDAAADAPAVDRRDDGGATVRDRGDRLLASACSRVWNSARGRASAPSASIGARVSPIAARSRP